MGHQAVVAIDGFQCREPDGSTFYPTGESGKLVRLYVADHNLEISMDEGFVCPDRRAARCFAQIHMQGSVFGVVRDYLVAVEHLGGQDGGKFIRCQRRMRANGNVEGDRRVGNAKVGKPFQQGWQQMVVGHRAGFIIDRDSYRAGVGKIRPSQLSPQVLQGGAHDSLRIRGGRSLWRFDDVHSEMVGDDCIQERAPVWQLNFHIL